jgi:hypothetical protein
MSFQKDADFERRKKIFEEIKLCNRNELQELYRIMKIQGEEISENRGGMRFDLNHVTTDTLNKIETWLQFCQKNRRTFESREKEMAELTTANPGITETI